MRKSCARVSDGSGILLKAQCNEAFKRYSGQRDGGKKILKASGDVPPPARQNHSTISKNEMR